MNNSLSIHYFHERHIYHDLSEHKVKYSSKSDPRSYEATIAAAKKSRKRFSGFNGIQVVAMLYQLSYEASLEAVQEQVK